MGSIGLTRVIELIALIKLIALVELIFGELTDLKAAPLITAKGLMTKIDTPSVLTKSNTLSLGVSLYPSPDWGLVNIRNAVGHPGTPPAYYVGTDGT
jgi:hypothetical protein